MAARPAARALAAWPWALAAAAARLGGTLEASSPHQGVAASAAESPATARPEESNQGEAPADAAC